MLNLQRLFKLEVNQKLIVFLWLCETVTQVEDRLLATVCQTQQNLFFFKVSVLSGENTLCLF